jgi:hypothetical protein
VRQSTTLANKTVYFDTNLQKVRAFALHFPLSQQGGLPLPIRPLPPPDLVRFRKPKYNSIFRLKANFAEENELSPLEIDSNGASTHDLGLVLEQIPQDLEHRREEIESVMRMLLVAAFRLARVSATEEEMTTYKKQLFKEMGRPKVIPGP